MFESQKLDRIIILILSVILAVVCFIDLRPKQANIDGGVIELRADTLKAENQRLAVQVIEYKKIIANKQTKIDSLQALKPQISKNYEKKFKEIDSKHVNGVVNEFNSIFSNNNIK